MLEVAILRVVPDLTQCEFNALLLLVSSEKQERIKKFHFFKDAQNCLLGDILFKNEICRVTGLKAKHLQISTNAHGKPFLVSYPNIHFNISHSKHYIACAVSEQPVGIDIEFIKPTDLKIAERFFTSDEIAYIMASNHMNRFYEIWTKKESRIKWEGKGLCSPLNSFSVLEQKNHIRYHKAFQNNEVICHVCSTQQTLLSTKVLDTAAFLQSIIL